MKNAWKLLGVSLAMGAVLLVGACSGAEATDVLGQPGTNNVTTSSSGTSGTTTSGGTSSGDPPVDAGFDAAKEAGPPECTWNKVDPCGPGKFCAAPGCGKGVCVDTPKVESVNRNPQCGCNGVTYWNATVAAKSGMPIRQNGACDGTSAETCGGISLVGCSGDTSCNYRQKSKNDCTTVAPSGTCWKVPTAPCANGALHAHPCGSAMCVDECSVIKAQAPWYDDLNCP